MLNNKHTTVRINFDIENQHIEQLLGFSLPQFPDDAGFYFIGVINADFKERPFDNYLVMRAMHVSFNEQTIELTQAIWYNLIQMCYQHKLIMLDGELLATDLPKSEVPRFEDVWGCIENFFYGYRKELML